MNYLNSDQKSIRPLDKQKIGYIKINSTKGQITFCIHKVSYDILYSSPNIHKNNIKEHNIIHLNVNTELFIDFASRIKQHIEMLIRMLLDLNIKDFKLLMHEFKSIDGIK